MSGAPTPWRSFSFYDRSRVEDIEALAKSEFSEIAASPSGNGQPAVPKISKHVVAYLEGLVAVPPYARCTADPRATGLAEGVADAVFDQLNKARKKDYMNFLKRKLGEWYRAALQGVLSQGPVWREEEGPEEPVPSAAGTAGTEDGESTADYGLPDFGPLGRIASEMYQISYMVSVVTCRYIIMMDDVSIPRYDIIA